MKLRLLIFCLVIHVVIFSQTNLFQKGDKVCFVGNSITNNGEFYHNILLYYATRFPEQPVTFFNCGISGDVCRGVLNRMDKDILNHHPTHAVIMIGMNDVNRGLYTVNPTSNADTLVKREEAINIYKVRLDSIVTIFLSKGIKVILQKPTIYEQTAKIPKENNFGVNDALKVCADYNQTLSDRYHLPIVDYWTILNNIDLELQQKDSTATIIGADRVHPGSPGHLIMAYQFLKTTKAPQYISEIVIENNAKASNKKSKNCLVSNYVNGKDLIRFKVKENALPFPVKKEQAQALALVSFINELSVEKLIIKNAGKSNQLIIDTTLIGFFSKEELANGINLSLYPNSPQYKQAIQVSAILDKMRRAASDLRTIAFVEYNFLTQYNGDIENAYLKKAYLDDLLKTKLSSSPYYKAQFDKFILVKPNQKQLEFDFEKYREDAYRLAIPKEHSFELTISNY